MLPIFFNSPECVESADTIGTFPESAPSVRGRVKKSKFPLKNVNLASFKYRHTSTNTYQPNGQSNKQKAGKAQLIII